MLLRLCFELPQADFQPDAGQKTAGLLVKKWTSVIRMQKKVSLCPLNSPYDLLARTKFLIIWAQILDLESRLAQALHDNMHMAALPSGFSKRNNPDWLPSVSPPKHTLTGHRDMVNTVAFHPVYSVLASGSDDCTLKVWDWETGELERTLKGHTRRITDCEYDSKGKHLGTWATFCVEMCAIGVLSPPGPFGWSGKHTIEGWDVQEHQTLSLPLPLPDLAPLTSH